MAADSVDMRSLIRTIPDYPKPGILFRDITTLIADPAGLRAAIDGLVLAVPHRRASTTSPASRRAASSSAARSPTSSAAASSRSARRASCPGETIGQDYSLEYGVDTIEIHADAIHDGARVLLIDDLIATGGTAEAAIELIRRSGGEIVAAAFVIDLPDLGGANRIARKDVTVHTLVSFEGH